MFQHPRSRKNIVGERHLSHLNYAVRLGTNDLPIPQRFEVLAEAADFVPFESASENMCGPRVLFHVLVPQMLEQFSQELFQQDDDDEFVPQDAVNTPALLIFQRLHRCSYCSHFLVYD